MTEHLCGEERVKAVNTVRHSMNEWLKMYREYVFDEPKSSEAQDVMLEALSLAIRDSFGIPAQLHHALDTIERKVATSGK